jgi:hypothetical protein
MECGDQSPHSKDYWRVKRDEVAGTALIEAIRPSDDLASLDAEAARHISRAQLLLRTFRNADPAEGDAAFDLTYERRRSRQLLAQNVWLRRNAEDGGHLPVEELLSSLEPFLLEIANLPDRPDPEEVRSIQERMQKKEIVAALQVDSARRRGCGAFA